MKGLSCYVFNLKNSSFRKPPSEVITIGFFDKSLSIHVKESYTRFFSNQNLYSGGSYVQFKKGVINLVLFEEKVLIRKTYSGSFKSKMKFYNEIECYNRLDQLKNVPKLLYVDYENLVIYLEYIGGEYVRKILESKQVYPTSLITKVSKHCTNALRKIHEKNFAVIDIQPQNIIYNFDKQDVFFIDFADSVCSSFVPKKYLRFLQNQDEMYLSERVLSKLL